MSNQNYCVYCESATELDDSREVDGDLYCNDCADKLEAKFRDGAEEIYHDR